MGKVQIISKKQEIILSEVTKNEFLTSNFYFTGGTALSLCYLKHRESVDLDFFSDKKFDSQKILEIVEGWSKKFGFSLQTRFVDPVYIFNLVFKDKEHVKLDFCHYPYKKLKERKKFKGQLRVDSKFDIAVNKLLSVNQRHEVKDFVDLYFLMKDFTFWDLREGVRYKFNIKIEPILAAADFLVVEDFEFLPKMLKPLTLDQLKKFFRGEAMELGKMAVE